MIKSQHKRTAVALMFQKVFLEIPNVPLGTVFADSHMLHCEQIQIKYSHAYYQSVNHLLTSGMVPWCQSEEPNKVKSVHNCGIVFPANFQVRCSECDNGRTHLRISSDRAIYLSVTYRYTE